MLILNSFSGIIYFYPGLKNDILGYEDYHYKLERTSANRKMYCCVRKEKLKCRARVSTSVNERKLYLKSLTHNHGPTFRNNEKLTSSEVVTVVKSFNKVRRFKKSLSTESLNTLTEPFKIVIVESDDYLT